MYHSGEVRWFFPGPVSAAAERWIAAGEHSTRQAARTDRYLVLPGCDTAGIKLREGNFEIKARTSSPEAMTWSESIAGFRDTWVKWSRDLQDLGAPGTHPRDGETWIDVSKQRRVRLFSLESGSPVEVAPGGPWLSAGCLVEQSVVRVAAQDYWSFCFEAFGQPDALISHLDTTVHYVAAEEPSLELPLTASRSYPAWLSTLVP
jgi:hypothetical protein